MYGVMFGGDQLTAARARGAKKSRANSTTCLSGLEPYVQDWHAKVIFHEVRNALMCIIIKGESFTGQNFCGFRYLSEKRKSFSCESFVLTITNILVPDLVVRKYCHNNPYTVDTAKI